MFGLLRNLSLPKIAVLPLPWRSMDSAPRDGTRIEIKCTYGAKPWTGIAASATHPIDGPIWQMDGGRYVEDTTAYRGRYSGANNNHLEWRPVD